MPFSTSAVKFTVKFLGTVTVLEVLLPEREHAQREQVQRTAPAQLRSGLGQNCRVKRSEVLLKGHLRPLSTCVQQGNTLAFRLVHHHSRTIIISMNKGVTPSGLKSIS